MKNIMIFIIIMIYSINLFSQNNIDPKPLFDKDTLALYDNRQYQFIKGWNWGSQ